MSCCCFVCVSEMHAGVVENCGKFDRVAAPGLNILFCPFEIMTKTLSLKIQQLEVKCDTKTKDNVFVEVAVAVHYKVVEDKVPSAHYKLTDPKVQIQSYVNDVIRSTLPHMDLDDAFASKSQLAENIRSQLASLMSDYGYEIKEALLIDLNPDNAVKAAMNEIMASQRTREAAAEKAEAEKILQVKAAEADADSKYLAGFGIARQRKAIVDGLKDTVNDFTNQVEGSTPQDVMDLLLQTQYFDMMKDFGKKGTNGATIFLPHGPESVSALRHQLKKEKTNN